MKTTIEKSVWMLIIAAALISCTKNDGNTVDPETDPDKERSGELLLIEEKVNGQTLFTFEYDDRNHVVVQRITTDGSEVIHSFTYDERGRLIAVDRKDDIIFMNESYAYEGNDDKPIGGIWTNHGKNGDDVALPVQYTYPNDHTVIETVFHEETVQTFTYTFDDKGNQLTANLDGALLEYNQYDDKKSCYSHYPWEWKIHHVNNARSVKIGEMIDQVWEFTYNDAGYPETAKMYNRGSDVVVETHEFRYKQAN